MFEAMFFFLKSLRLKGIREIEKMRRSYINDNFVLVKKKIKSKNPYIAESVWFF